MNNPQIAPEFTDTVGAMLSKDSDIVSVTHLYDNDNVVGFEASTSNMGGLVLTVTSFIDGDTQYKHNGNTVNRDDLLERVYLLDDHQSDYYVPGLRTLHNLVMTSLSDGWDMKIMKSRSYESLSENRPRMYFNAYKDPRNPMTPPSLVFIEFDPMGDATGIHWAHGDDQSIVSGDRIQDLIDAIKRH